MTMTEQQKEQPRDFSINPRTGKELADIRKGGKINQTKLAKRIGITRGDLGSVESGKFLPGKGMVVFQDRYIGAVREILEERLEIAENYPPHNTYNNS